ncbi:hypothetical protein [Vagococcus humatus]|uniref:Uncharacterized protein n=1 Tax=Vagococcus humatus TaxID=1889241 RepID=A0A429Z7D3_9ENTE|nr:hypothetical protein [Vagococcus humatus]RST89592.1 hypothetical protein C7P63_00485 [Vagococcus humatus]
MLFNRGKKSDDSSYYDDYYYDYYYEDDDASSNSANELDVTEELKKQLGAANQKIQQLQSEKEAIELQYSAVKALPKHYEELEKEKMNLQLKLQEAQLTQNSEGQKVSELEGKLEKYRTEMNNLKQELEAKQQELDILSEKMLNLPEETSKEPVKDSSDVTSQDLSQQKEEIANVLLEARAQARQIVEQANYHARHKMLDAENELQQVKENAASFYKRVEQTKFESDIVFEELLHKLTQLSEDSREEEHIHKYEDQ